MKTDQTKNGGVVGGLFWSFLERIASQLVSMIVGIILARLLTPDEYGIIAIVMIFITSFSMSVSIIIYWITNSILTIIQNLLMKRSK